MAYKYQYHFKNAGLRDAINLIEYKDKIENTLNELFKSNIKDTNITNDYFEFKLYRSVPRKYLQYMGKKLRPIFHQINQSYGFMRKSQNFYAIIHIPEELRESNLAHIEFIDSSIIDDSQFFQRAKNYYSGHINKEYIRDTLPSKENEFYEDSSSHMYKLINNYYIDISESYVDISSLSEYIDISDLHCNDSNLFLCYKVIGYHSHTNTDINDHQINPVLLNINCDVEYLKLENHISVDKLTHKDCLMNIQFKKTDISILDELNEELDLTLDDSTDLGPLNGVLKNKKINFKVHNVGQALATSLSYLGESPFLYFDYGMPDNFNKKTIPSTTDIPIEPRKNIILSHIHADHWNGLYYNINAYQCNWHIPNQRWSKLFNKKISEIESNGGSVKILDSTISYNGLSVVKSNTLSSPSTHKHESGLIFKITALDILGNNINILIPGDQRYSHINAEVLDDIDILVACHHGGVCYTNMPPIIPRPRNSASTIIYSYGHENRHKHPEPKIVSQYKAHSWLKDHHTPIDNAYSIEILI